MATQYIGCGDVLDSVRQSASVVGKPEHSHEREVVDPDFDRVVGPKQARSGR